MQLLAPPQEGAPGVSVRVCCPQQLWEQPLPSGSSVPALDALEAGCPRPSKSVRTEVCLLPGQGHPACWFLVLERLGSGKGCVPAPGHWAELLPAQKSFPGHVRGLYSVTLGPSRGLSCAHSSGLAPHQRPCGATLKRQFRHSSLTSPDLAGLRLSKEQLFVPAWPGWLAREPFLPPPRVLIGCRRQAPVRAAQRGKEGGPSQAVAPSFPPHPCAAPSCLETTVVSPQTELCSASPPKLDSAAKWCFRQSAKYSGDHGWGAAVEVV